MLTSHIFTFRKNPVYTLIRNIGSGPSTYFISREKIVGSKKIFELFALEPEAKYTKTLNEAGEEIRTSSKRLPFISDTVYKALLNEVKEKLDSSEVLEESFSNVQPYSINELLTGGVIPEQKGEESMSTLEIKTFMKEMQEQQLEVLKGLTINNPYEDAIVEAIINKGKGISADSIVSEVKTKLDSFIAKEYGALPKRIEVKVPDKDAVKLEGIFHAKFEHILQLVTVNIPTLLIGPAGSGKNHTLEQIAKALSLDFYFSNAITQEFKLTGFIDANGHYHETQFYKAFVNGGLFFLDEVDASIPEVLLILNSAIANRYFDFPTGRVEAHPEFRVVAAGNTMGTGADNMYTGRSQLDAATIDRFAQVQFDYDSEVEKQLASNTDLYDFVVNARKAVQSKGLRYTVSMRSIINASKIDGIIDDMFAVEGIILKTMPKDEMKMIADSLPESNRYTKALHSLIGWSNRGTKYSLKELQQLATAA